MPSDSSITLDTETAVTVGSWLQSMSQHDSLEPAVAEPLAGLAAAIGDRVREQEVSEAAPLELSVTTVAPSNGPSHSNDEDHSASAGEPTDENPPTPTGHGDEGSLTEPSARPPSQVYDDLPAHAWDACPAHGDTSSNRDHAGAADDPSSPLGGAGGEAWESEAAPPSQFVTAYECEVCGGVHEMEASVKVCAYVADCPVCGAVDTRFTAIEIPMPRSEGARSS
ncbi:hypothetical protein [Saliphagus infecundisoli]|uniref:Uncharacterized protein n=1 Tax=Saliphagus infecundisoli TaxID=1849069 RepID=A0ABD5QJC1_9EURY|nr:hypothetical protein [Saliphagus infecundisoli]